MRANPFFATASATRRVHGLGVVWVLLVLLAGVALFRRREL